jgi:hypothetical protein
MATPKHALVLRSRAQRGVSKDGPARTNEAAGWIILRDAMLRIAPQDEVSGKCASRQGLSLGVS